MNGNSFSHYIESQSISQNKRFGNEVNCNYTEGTKIKKNITKEMNLIYC